jgi:hypothetical protein
VREQALSVLLVKCHTDLLGLLVHPLTKLKIYNSTQVES